jgi:hypothetical protein
MTTGSKVLLFSAQIFRKMALTFGTVNADCLALTSRLVGYFDELLYLRDGGAGEVLHWDEGVLQVGEGVVRGDLLGGQGDKVVDPLLNQESNLGQ